MRRTLAILALLVSLVATATADDAGEKARARQLLQQGNTLYQQGSFEGALVLFRKAFAIYHSPKLLLSTSACEKMLGHPARAATDLAEFLRLREQDPTSAAEALVIRARADLTSLAERLGQIVVEGEGAQLEVSIDGEDAPRTSYASLGEHRVRVVAPKQPEFATVVHLTAGGVATVRRPPEPVAPPIRVLAPVIEPVVAAPLIATPPRRRARWIVPVAVVSSIVVVGLGVGLGLGFGLAKTAPHGSVGTVQFTP